MSTEIEKLGERIEGILEAGDMMLNPPDDLAGFVDKGAVKKSRTDQILQACKEAGFIDKALVCQTVCRFRMESKEQLYCGAVKCPLDFFSQVKEIELKPM